MKKTALNLIKLFFFLLIINTLSACVDKPGIWHNEQIAAGKRADFHTLNEQVLKALKSGSMDTLGAFLSRELIEDVGTSRQVELVSNQLKAADYTLLDEYYLIRDTAHIDSSIKIASPVNGKNAYTLNYVGAAGKNYIVLFVPKNSHDPGKYMISITYYKYDYGWKVSSIDVGQYTVNNQTSPELYDAAKLEYNKKYFVNALNIMQSASYCLKPVQLWSYPQEDEINQFYSSLMNDANSKYRFPLVLTQVPTHPKIFSIMNQKNDDGTYPIIYYQSGIKLSDTTGLKKENDQIQRVIGSIIPGIDKDGKYLLYSVYNEMPNASKSVNRFDITEKISR